MSDFASVSGASNTTKPSWQHEHYTSPFTRQATPDAVQPDTTPSSGNTFDQILAALDSGMNTAAAEKNGENTLAANKPYDVFDIIDMINPLQHIPVLSNIYRAVTGDEIRQEIRIAGSMVIGTLTGPVGMVTGLSNAAVDFTTDKPIGDHVLTAVAPELEQNIRQNYSIAHYWSPTSDGNDATQDKAEKIALTSVPTSDTLMSDNLWQYPDFTAPPSTQAVAAVATMDIEEMGPAQAAASRFVPEMPVRQTEIFASLPHENTTVAAENPAKSPVASPNTISTEASDMARSITQNPQAVMHISPAAAKQLSQLANASQSLPPSTATNDPMAWLHGDVGQQVRAATAKNRQLGLALDSSAMINQKISDAEQDQVSFELGSRVATLYNQNAATMNSEATSLQPLSNTSVATPFPTLPQAKPEPETSLSPQEETSPISLLPTQEFFRPTATQSATQATAPRPTQAVKPDALGQHYHGADATVNLSIAQAMQRALEKYRNLQQ